MPSKKSLKPAVKDKNNTKFVNQKKISPGKSMKTKLGKVSINDKQNKLKSK
jgi:hypothetical protein